MLPLGREYQRKKQAVYAIEARAQIGPSIAHGWAVTAESRHLETAAGVDVESKNGMDFAAHGGGTLSMRDGDLSSIRARNRLRNNKLSARGHTHKPFANP